ncbi:MAG: hypothetical protein AAGG57_14450 [Pseudomonadota bacterium]
MASSFRHRLGIPSGDVAQFLGRWGCIRTPRVTGFGGPMVMSEIGSKACRPASTIWVR